MDSHRPNRIRFIVIITICLGLFSGATVGAFLALTRDLPQIRELENFEPSAITHIYSADQVLLGELFMEKRSIVPIGQFPADLITALVTIEDRNFYSHSGIDLKGILRAIVKDILAGHFAEGASTITQQLAKTLFLTKEKTLTRKAKEAILAFQLERRYTKDEILALYLNQIYFGSGAYGVESAAQRYFGKPASQMDLSQCALIAGLPQAPSTYSPLNHPDLAAKRRNLVLRVMRRQGLIDDNQYQAAITQPVRVSAQEKAAGAAPYFVQYIKPGLEAVVGPDLLYKGGLTVHTSLSYRLQQQACQALGKGLQQIQERRKQQGQTSSAPQGALVAIDVKTGGILAMVGGRDFSESAFNRAVSAHRQPGSAFKPIVYALAIAHGFSQASLVLDAPVVFKAGSDNKDWQPENFSKSYQGEMTLRYALAHSKNIPVVRLVERLGPSAVVQFAHQLGIGSSLSPNLSIGLGTSSTTLLEITAAYAVFPNGGISIPPFGVSEMLDRNNALIWRVKPSIRPALTEPQAAIMVDMLQGVIKEGTGQAAQQLNLPLAGKTGTTNKYRDALFVGFSPSVATGVWVGMDDFSPLGDLETGARAALPIWIEFMDAASADGAALDFTIPDNMKKTRINPLTGRKADENDQHAVTALFVKGTEPFD
ncbi:PbpA: penicillin-binding protein 1A [Desulfosarcina variabilis str. Montpellier]|uniref:penicillin-binding protein 1A n=1 Tax=Desulfosarcina variabilis TaxID=2300 RepID=UPI003AFA9B7C